MIACCLAVFNYDVLRENLLSTSLSATHTLLSRQSNCKDSIDNLPLNIVYLILEVFWTIWVVGDHTSGSKF
jgi:hypothetical protein